jgi:hypothetical protein
VHNTPNMAAGNTAAAGREPWRGGDPYYDAIPAIPPTSSRTTSRLLTAAAAGAIAIVVFFGSREAYRAIAKMKTATTATASGSTQGSTDTIVPAVARTRSATTARPTMRAANAGPVSAGLVRIRARRSGNVLGTAGVTPEGTMNTVWYAQEMPPGDCKTRLFTFRSVAGAGFLTRAAADGTVETQQAAVGDESEDEVPSADAVWSVRVKASDAVNISNVRTGEGLYVGDGNDILVEGVDLDHLPVNGSIVQLSGDGCESEPMTIRCLTAAPDPSSTPDKLVWSVRLERRAAGGESILTPIAGASADVTGHEVAKAGDTLYYGVGMGDNIDVLAQPDRRAEWRMVFNVATCTMTFTSAQNGLHIACDSDSGRFLLSVPQNPATLLKARFLM